MQILHWISVLPEYCRQAGALWRRIWLAWFILIGGVSAQGPQQWQFKAPLPAPRQGMAAAALENKIYVMGGSQFEHSTLNIVQAYDTEQDTWQTDIAPLNEARINAAAAVFDGKIYIFGGRDHNQLVHQVEAYDPLNNQWSVVGQLPTPREGLAAVVVDTAIWVIGGAAFQTNYNIVEQYNPSTNNWSTLPHTLTVPRVAAVAAHINGEVYVFGGFYFGPLNSYEKYVFDLGWVGAGNMLYPCGSAAGAAAGGEIWIVGGENQLGTLDEVQHADITGAGNWSNGPAMHVRRKNLAAVRVGNRLFAIGGRTGQHGGGGVSAAVEALDLLTGLGGLSEPALNDNFYLSPNYPNPFNGSTYVETYLPKAAEVEIGVLDLLGRLTRRLYRGRLPSGWQRFEFDGRDDFGRVLPSGQYFIYLHAGGKKRVVKATFSK
ncbi:MAG: hypothetical protein HUU32_16220 [Calditrichaceae bacterium]|nr:hypothetical protein [Calditrichia bacterium]NUQ42935.1 hypothetical protein [Calditrichaceae bacterium]